MRIEYTGRNIAITKALREHVLDKLEHAARDIPEVLGAHVILEVAKYRHNAEIVVRRRRLGTLTGQASSRDMYQSIQKAVERIEKQIRRDHDKVITRKRRGSTEKVSVAEAALEAEPTPPLAPAPEARPRVVKESADRVRPIAVEEAIPLLDTARRSFVVFRNSASGRIAVLYRRADGQFGLVEPKV